MKFVYPVRFEPDGNDVVITCRDLFGASQSISGPAALLAAQDFIGTCIDMLVESGRPVPRPSRKRDGEVLVSAPIDSATVAGLDTAMRANGVNKSELARRLGKDEKEVRRLLDPRHGSKLSSYRLAFRALETAPQLDLG